MKNLLSFSFLLFLASCSHSSKSPNNILAFEEMQKVTWDCLQTDEFLLNYIFKDTLIKKDSIAAIKYEEIFKLHKTSKEQFFESLKYYQSKPDIYKALMDSISSLGFKSKKENEINNKKKIRAIKDFN